jgi:hypothetical protein
MKCQEFQPSCDSHAGVYRQCPNTSCKHEIGYCNEHGGDERAQREMVEHIKQHGRTS